mgnify:CR=1 FL=1
MEYKDFWLRTNTQIKLLNKTQRGLALECGFTERRIETLSSTCRSPDVIEAVKIAKKITAKDKICLLSPAAASYEFFKNFEEKGKHFKSEKLL